MHSPLAITTLGQLSVPGTITYLQGGAEVSVTLETIDVEFTLVAEDAAFAMDAIAVEMADAPQNMKVETDEITIDH